MINESNDLKTDNIVIHPWRRFFARCFDLRIYGLILIFFEVIVLRIDVFSSNGAAFLNLIFASLIMLFVEPILLSVVGTTPGKWIFGLVLTSLKGGKLSLKEAYARTFVVLSHGYGYQIPLYSLYRLYKSYDLCVCGKAMPWDDGNNYHIKDKKNTRIIGLILALGVIYFMTQWVAFQGNLPINRGPLTTEEYIENCNDYIKYKDLKIGKKLSSNATWIREDVKPNINNIVLYSSILPKHEIVEKNDVVNEVTLTFETKNKAIIHRLDRFLLMSYTAFVGADENLSYRQLFSDPIIQKLQNSFDDFEYTIADIKVIKKVEMKGYKKSDKFLFSKEGTDRFFKLTFKMKKKNN